MNNLNVYTMYIHIMYMYLNVYTMYVHVLTKYVQYLWIHSMVIFCLVHVHTEL